MLQHPGSIYEPFPANFEDVCTCAFGRMSSLRALVAVTRWYEQLVPPQVR